jgi:hypothetical protein
MRRSGSDFGYFRDPIFLCCLAVYLVNREAIKPHLLHYSSFFHGHLNDCLFVPVALPLFLWVYRRLGLRPDDGAPRWWEVALHLAAWSVFFKWLGPAFLHRGVADPVDLFCYASGGAAAWWGWRTPWKIGRPREDGASA